VSTPVAENRISWGLNWFLACFGKVHIENHLGSFTAVPQKSDSNPILPLRRPLFGGRAAPRKDAAPSGATSPGVMASRQGPIDGVAKNTRAIEICYIITNHHIAIRLESLRLTAITTQLKPESKRGRPLVYDWSAIWPQVLEHIASGDALSTALKRLGPDAPSYVWAKTQLRMDPTLQAAYREAIEDRADALADDIIALADTPPPPGLDGPGLHAWVAQLKLRVHAREWTASKLRPKVYGASVDVTVQATSISITAALEQAQRRILNVVAEDTTAPQSS
jgi:hypothetical protein